MDMCSPQLPVLSVRDLTIGLPRGRPVSAVNFDLHSGETLAIVGESGSGKTLTALSLMGLLPDAARVERGAAVLDGRNLLALPERVLRTVRGRRIGMVFQEPATSLNPLFKVGHQVAQVLALHTDLTRREIRHRAVELLDLARVPDPQGRYHAYPHELSGGLRQRVMIAMAIACRPDVLIADEPTTALDVTVQAHILELIDGLRRDLRMAVLLITHDLDVVGQWADRVLVMYAGRVVEEGPTRIASGAGRHPYTSDLAAASPRHGATTHYSQGPLCEIPGSIASAADEPGCPYVPRCRLARPSCRAFDGTLTGIRGGGSVACPVVSEKDAS